MNSKEFKNLINYTIFEECKMIEERKGRLYYVIPLHNKIAKKIDNEINKGALIALGMIGAVS